MALRTLIGSAALAVLTLTLSGTASSYPINAENTGIKRLQGANPDRMPAGAMLGIDAITPHLLATPGAAWDFADAERDPELQTALEQMFKGRSPSYGIIVADISDPADIRWAGVRETRSQIPGSVGKIIHMLALFAELETAFPEIEDRERILRERMITSGRWVVPNHHAVPRLQTDGKTLKSGPLGVGETFALSEWLDFAIAYSSNAAAATIWKEVILLRHYGSAYPPSAEQEAEYFKVTPKSDLWALARDAVTEPMIGAGLDPDALWIGSFWTGTAKQLVPGNGGSRGTPLEMARFMLRMEQGRLVDNWSSARMKAYLYTTSRRYRYVFSDELKPAAVYFKSGSLYKCVPEEDFKCGKYMGNDQNLMNSVTLVETPAIPAEDEAQRRYIVALMSDVRKTNSAWDHSRIGAAVDKMVRTRAAAAIAETASEADKRAAGG
jgi:hypothetical protein